MDPTCDLDESKYETNDLKKEDRIYIIDSRVNMYKLRVNIDGDTNVLDRKILRKHEKMAGMLERKLSSAPF